MSIFKSIVILALVAVSACTDSNNHNSPLTCETQSQRSCVSFNSQCLATIQEACWSADKVCTDMCGTSSKCDSCHAAADKACSDGMEVCAIYDSHCPEILTSICENPENQ